jgi:hypothetical protein
MVDADRRKAAHFLATETRELDLESKLSHRREGRPWQVSNGHTLSSQGNRRNLVGFPGFVNLAAMVVTTRFALRPAVGWKGR